MSKSVGVVSDCLTLTQSQSVCTRRSLHHTVLQLESSRWVQSVILWIPGTEYARSMDLAAQSMDPDPSSRRNPWIAQKSVDRTE